MLNKMAEKVHAGNQITTHQNHANFNYLQDYAFKSKTELRKSMELMQMENNRLYNENQHYKNRCLELMEKLQSYQEKEHPTEPKILRIAI